MNYSFIYLLSLSEANEKKIKKLDRLFCAFVLLILRCLMPGGLVDEMWSGSATLALKFEKHWSSEKSLAKLQN